MAACDWLGSRSWACLMSNIWKCLLLLLIYSHSVVERNTTAKEKMSFLKVDASSDFSFHNLPYGIFSTPDHVSAVFIISTGFA